MNNAVDRNFGGTSGTSGTTLISNGNSCPTHNEACGTSGTGQPAAAVVVPLVPPRSKQVGPQNPNHINVVPPVPLVPHDLDGRRSIASILEDAGRLLGPSTSGADVLLASVDEGGHVDEHDAAQERGEVATPHDGRLGRSAGERPPTAKDSGLSRKQVHEARQIRDAKVVGPVVVERSLDGRLSFELWEVFEERAALLEFDAGFSRQEAEDLAARDVGYADAAHYRAELSGALPMIGGEYGKA